MWQEVVDWFWSFGTPKAPQSPEEREKFLEAKVKALEAKAVWMEREAKLRERAVDAGARIKAVTPRVNYARWVVLGAGLFILFLIIKSCV